MPLPRWKARAETAIKAIEQAPGNQAVQQEQQRSKQCQDIFGQRQAARHSHGKSSETLRVSTNEPEAMVQRLKRGRGFAVPYKPSVLANEDRIIVAHALDASSETLMAPMLEQSARVTGMQADALPQKAHVLRPERGAIFATIPGNSPWHANIDRLEIRRAAQKRSVCSPIRRRGKHP